MTTSTRPTLAAQLSHKRLEVALLVCAGAIYFFAYFQRVAVPGQLFNELQAAFRLDAGAVTALGAIYLYIYGGMQLFAGLMNDRLGANRVLLLGGLLLGIGSILFPLAPSYPLLVAARALVGLGSSLIYISLVKALATLFSPRHFAPLLSLVMFAGTLGGLAGTLPVKWLAGLWGWRAPLLGAGILCIVAFLGTALSAARAPRPVLEATPLLPTLRAVLRNRPAWPLLFTGPVNFAIYFLLQTIIGVKFLRDVAGIPESLASTFTFIMMLVNMSIVLSGGFLVERFGRRRKPFIVLGVGCLLLGALLLLVGLRLSLPAGWFLGCYILLALSSFASPVGNVLMREMNPTRTIGTAIGILNGLCYLGVAALASAAGALMDRFVAGARVTAAAIVYPREAYLAIFLLCAVLAAAALVSALLLRETYGETVAEDAA